MFQIAQGILALALCVPTGMFDSLVIFSFKSQSNYLAYSCFEKDNGMDSRQKVQPGDRAGQQQTRRANAAMASEGYKRQLSSRRGRVMCRWNWFQFATKDATINGNLRNATAETEGLVPSP